MFVFLLQVCLLLLLSLTLTPTYGSRGHFTVKEYRVLGCGSRQFLHSLLPLSPSQVPEETEQMFHFGQAMPRNQASNALGPPSTQSAFPKRQRPPPPHGVLLPPSDPCSLSTLKGPGGRARGAQDFFIKPSLTKVENQLSSYHLDF